MDQLAGYASYYGPPSSGDGFDLRELIRKIRKRKYLIASLVLIVTTVVTVDSFRNVSYYQSTA
jgi:capsular polysaccharide biosynthesis protein